MHFDASSCRYNHIIANGRQALDLAYQYLPVTGRMIDRTDNRPASKRANRKSSH